MHWNELSERLHRFIQETCEAVGPRLSASRAERRAGRLIRAEYDKLCQETHAEEFTCHPTAFLASARWSMGLYLFGVCFYLWLPWVTFVLSVVALYILVGEVLLTREVIDRFFEEMKGINIYGKIKPAESTRRIVLVSGHHDSAYEFPLFETLGHWTFVLTPICLALAVATAVLALARALAPAMFPTVSGWLDWLAVVPFVNVAPILWIAIRVRSSIAVVGANDNLSGVSITLGIGQWLQENRLKHTEVWLVSFACEECMRGSKRFAMRHRDELRDAYLLNFESVGAGKLYVITEEPMYHVKLTPELCAKAAKAAQNAGLEVPLIKPPMGGTDSTNFIRAGLKATTVIGIAGAAPAHWHTVNDVPENIEPPVLVDAVKTGVAFLQLVDEEESRSANGSAPPG